MSVVGAVLYRRGPGRAKNDTQKPPPMTDRLAWLPLRRRSIAVRLAVSSFLSSTAILVIAAFILTTLYRENTERAFDSRLLVFANNLATDLVSPSDPETRSFSLGDPRFDLPLSGWYWQVGRPDAKPRDLRTSRSLVGVPLKGPIRRHRDDRPDPPGLRPRPGRPDAAHRRARRRCRPGGALHRAGRRPADEIVNDVERFRFSLFMTFGLLGFSLAATALLQIRFGLAPLRALRTALGTIRRGEADRIDGQYPRDIAPLAGEINLLIETNREILERARTQVGNLAHALKTPLSIIVNEVGSSEAPPELAEKIREQAAVMRDQVNYHLDRARAAALAGTLGTSTEVEPALAGLVRTFGKIYRDKDIAYEVHVSPGLRFRGEKQDFEEMIGNLVDNASKWAHGRVSISAAPIGEDDYPHLIVGGGRRSGPARGGPRGGAEAWAPPRRDQAGSGLGLSIVADLPRSIAAASASRPPGWGACAP